MNREIKFRAWDKLNSCWLFGYELPNLGGFSLLGEVVLMGQLNTIPLSRLYTDIEVMQYTGLKDKNGKEIYEGDIFCDVFSTEKMGVVEYGRYQHCFDRDEIKYGGHIGFYVAFGIDYMRKDLLYWSSHSQVIGNIYENPELLKDEK